MHALRSVKGDLNAAEQSYRDAVRLNARSVEAEDGLADVAIAKKDFTLLAQVADSIIGMAPQYAPAYVYRGIAASSRKEYDKAEADFKQAIKLDPKSSNAYLQLAQLEIGLNHLPQSRPLLDQALLNNPNSARALGLLVSLDLYDKQPAKAIARVQDQIAKVPNNVEMYVQLSDLQLMTGDPKSALATADKAMKLNPGDSAAVMAYSRSQVALGDTGKAIASWQQWIKDHPTDASALTILGALQESQGDKTSAATSYKKALQIQPELGVAANNLAYLMIESGQNLDVALSLAQTARRVMPNAPSTADTLAWAYYQKQSYFSARDLLEEALKTAPGTHPSTITWA